MPDASRIAGLMAEPDRRRVVAALILSSGDVADVARRTGLSRREVVSALDRLTAGGLVVESNGHYVVLEQAFKVAARASAPTPAASEFSSEPAERRAILDRAIQDGRLVHLPTKRSKRLVVLDHVVQRFEPGVRYTERHVNAALAAVYDDTATLRRYLVDESFLDRGGGEYWRSGGTV